MHKKYLLLLVLTNIAILSSFAQARFDLNTPITNQGVGQLHTNQPIRNIGMGGTGIANGHQDYINFQNPALLTSRRGLFIDTASIKYTKWETSLYNFNNQYRSPEVDASGNTINFNQFSYLFPIGHRWATAFSLNPYSHVNYNIHSTTSEGDAGELTQNRRGYGGLYQASFINSLNISRNFSAGLQASYIFGRIRDEYFVGATSQAILDKYGHVDNIHYRGFMLKPGLAYRGRLNPGAGVDSVVYFNVGLTYEFFPSMYARSERRLQTRSQREQIHSDTLISSMSATANFPSSYRGGISFDKPGRWSIGADFSYTPWSEFQAPGQNEVLSDNITVSLGGEYNRRSPEAGELKNRPYRAGISYSRGNLTYRGTELHDIALSLGTSLPVGRTDPVDKLRPLTKINLALVMGQRSTFAGDGLRERYANIYAGVLINDKWFRRRRIN